MKARQKKKKKKLLNLYSRWEDANSPFCLILNLEHFCKHFWKFYLDVAFIWNFTVQKRCKIHMRVEYFNEETLDIFNTKINWCKPNCTCELIARVAGTLKKRDFCTSVTSWKTPLQSEKYLSIAPWLIFFKKEKKFLQNRLNDYFSLDLFEFLIFEQPRTCSVIFFAAGILILSYPSQIENHTRGKVINEIVPISRS